MHPIRPIFWALTAALLAVPAAHPLLIPWVGVPSHLLWWVHVLPVALVTFRTGRRGAGGILLVSATLVALGELAFGAGYGVPADWPTVWSLTAALTFTNALVAGFALYARGRAGLYRVLFDAAVSGVIRTDRDLRVEAANPAALQLLGVEWDEIRGRPLRDVPGLARLPAPSELEKAGWSGALLVRRQGQEAEIHLVAAAVAHDEPAGFQILLVDRTHEVAQEREMERQARLATLGEALAGVAHELANPLSVITSWSALALEPGTSVQEMREGLTAIRDQAERMRGLLGELLGYSRSPRDGAQVRVDEMVERLVRMQRVAYGAKVRIEARVAWSGEVWVPAGKVEQILVNLLANAAHAVSPGAGRVELAVREDAGAAVFQVSDNGPGVPRELAERIFDPFVTTKPEGEGAGLGLAISRRLARAMGGSLTVGSGVEGGAVFTLRVPGLAVSEAPETEPVPRPSSVMA